MKHFRIFLNLCFVFFLLSGLACDPLDDDTGHDNPFDPTNPENEGDPYDLQWEFADGGIKFTWNRILDPVPDGYHLYRKFNDEDFLQYKELPDTSTYTDTVSNGNRYEYFIVAHADGIESDTSETIGVTIDTEPVFYINSSSSEFTSTRLCTLSILAYGGENMLLSNSPEFEDAEWEAYSTTKPWILETGEGTKYAYLKIAYDRGDTSLVVMDSIEPQSIEPTATINDDAEATSSIDVQIYITGTGAIQYQLANTPFDGGNQSTGELILQQQTEPIASTEDSPETATQLVITDENTSLFTEDDGEWFDLPEDGICPWTLHNGEGTKTVYVRVRNDFLIEAEADDSIDPQLPQGISISINETNESYSNPVLLDLTAEYADSMSISLTEETCGDTWVAYSENVLFDLLDSIIVENSGPQALNLDHPSISGPQGSLFGDDISGGSVSLQSGETAARSLESLLNELDEIGYTFHARFKNSFEVPSAIETADHVFEIPSAVSIEDDADSTSSRFVTLTLSSEAADEMALDTSRTNLETSPNWINFESTVEDFALTCGYGDGTKTVYAKFRGHNTPESGIFEDDIYVHEVENPYVEIISPTEDDTVSSYIVDLAISADFADMIMISNRDDFAGAIWQVIADTIRDWDLSEGRELTRSGPTAFRSQRHQTNRSRNSDTTGEISLLNDPAAWFTHLDELDSDTCAVYVRFKNSFEVPSDPATDDVIMEIRADVNINGGENTSITRNVEVSVDLLNGAVADSVAWDIDSTSLDTNPDFQPFTDTINDVRLPTGPGTKSVYVRLSNWINGTRSMSRIYRDDIEPAAVLPQITINDGAETAQDTLVELGITADGGYLMRIANETQPSDPQQWVSFEAGVFNYPIPSGDGAKTVYVEVMNDFEIPGEFASDAINPQLVENPSAVILTPNENDTTNVNVVDVQLSADYATQFQLSNNSLLDEAPWLNLADYENGVVPGWDLLQGRMDELDARPYTVWASFRNAFEVPTDTVDSDTIYVEIRATIAINNGDEYTSTRDVTIYTTLIDAEGVDLMVLGMEEDTTGWSLLDPTNPTGWETFNNAAPFELPAGDGEKTVYAMFGSSSNNVVSGIYEDSIYPNGVNPTISINNNDESTPTRYVSLHIESGGGPTEMRIANDAWPEEVDPWIVFQADSLGHPLATGSGTKEVYVEVRNEFGIEGGAMDAIEPLLPHDLALEIESPTENDTVCVPIVTLNLDALDADSVMLSNRDDFTGATWQEMTGNEMSVENWNLIDGLELASTQPGRNESERTPLQEFGDLVAPWIGRREEVILEVEGTEYTVYAIFKNDFEVPTDPPPKMTLCSPCGDRLTSMTAPNPQHTVMLP